MICTPNSSAPRDLSYKNQQPFGRIGLREKVLRPRVVGLGDIAIPVQATGGNDTDVWIDPAARQRADLFHPMSFHLPAFRNIGIHEKARFRSVLIVTEQGSSGSQ